MAFISSIDQDLGAGAELDITLTLPAEVTRGSEVFIRAMGKVVRVDKKPENGSSRVGVAAVIERYEIIRNEPPLNKSLLLSLLAAIPSIRHRRCMSAAFDDSQRYIRIPRRPLSARTDEFFIRRYNPASGGDPYAARIRGATTNEFVDAGPFHRHPRIQRGTPPAENARRHRYLFAGQPLPG